MDLAYLYEHADRNFLQFATVVIDEVARLRAEARQREERSNRG